MKKLCACLIAVFIVLPRVNTKAQDNPNIGKEAPDLDLAGWATSKTITQDELEGRPYVLEFWATWCPPCRKSIPHLNEMSQRLEPFGLRVLGLSDESQEKVKPFAAEMGMTYYVGVGHEMKGLTYRGIPFAAVIGTDGKVVWAGHPMDPVFEKICWNVTRGYASAAMKTALEHADKGPLGPVYKALLKVNGEEAETAREIIQKNLKLRLKFAAAAEGLERYNALYETKTLYAGVPGVDVASEQIAEVLEDPEVQKAVQQQKPMRELETKIETIQAAAMKMQEEKSEKAAMDYYFGELIPIFEAFVENNPEHPETPNIKQAIQQIKARQDAAE